MNNFQLQFPCEIKKKPYEILVNDQCIKLRNFDHEILIKLNLQLQLQWQFYGDELIGFKILNLEVEAETEYLNQLRQFLGFKVSYKNIKQFYSFEETLYNNLNNETKIRKLKSLRDLRVVACKCFSKLQRSYSDIIQEIQLLKELQIYSFFPKIYEIFDSQQQVYLVMEYCYRKFDNDFNDEEFKIIIQSLLQSIQQLQLINIAHKRLTRSHILLDNENKVKLIGFRQCAYKVASQNELELDLYKIGSLFYKFYQQLVQSEFELCPYIPDQGNDILLQILSLPKANQNKIENALQHPYFFSLQGEGLKHGINMFNKDLYEMKPKFKDFIINQSSNPQISKNVSLISTCFTINPNKK